MWLPDHLAAVVLGLAVALGVCLRRQKWLAGAKHVRRIVDAVGIGADRKFDKRGRIEDASGWHRGNLVVELHVPETDAVGEAAGREVNPDHVIAGVGHVLKGLERIGRKGQHVAVLIVGEAIENLVVVAEVVIHPADSVQCSRKGELKLPVRPEKVPPGTTGLTKSCLLRSASRKKNNLFLSRAPPKLPPN